MRLSAQNVVNCQSRLRRFNRLTPLWHPELAPPSHSPPPLQSEDVKPNMEKTIQIAIKEGVSVSRCRTDGERDRDDAGHGRHDSGRVLRHFYPHSLPILQDNNPIMFKVKRTIKFEKIFAAFATKKGTSPEAYKFSHDGDQVMKDDTPESLGLDEGDQIDAMVQQTGGSVLGKIHRGCACTRCAGAGIASE